MNQRPSAILRAGLRWTDNVRESDGRGTTQKHGPQNQKKQLEAPANWKMETKQGSSELLVSTAIR